MHGQFTQGNGWQSIKFPTFAEGRYFCLESLSSFDGKLVSAIAELDVLGSDGKPISRDAWKIIYADSEETNNGNYTADKIFDLQESTFWSTVNKATFPHQIIIDLGEKQTISGFKYLPRAEKGAPGQIKEYRVYIKTDNFSL